MSNLQTQSNLKNTIDNLEKISDNILDGGDGKKITQLLSEIKDPKGEAKKVLTQYANILNDRGFTATTKSGYEGYVSFIKKYIPESSFPTWKEIDNGIGSIDKSILRKQTDFIDNKSSDNQRKENINFKGVIFNGTELKVRYDFDGLDDTIYLKKEGESWIVDKSKDDTFGIKDGSLMETKLSDSLMFLNPGPNDNLEGFHEKVDSIVKRLKGDLEEVKKEILENRRRLEKELKEAEKRRKEKEKLEESKEGNERINETEIKSKQENSSNDIFYTSIDIFKEELFKGNTDEAIFIMNELLKSSPNELRNFLLYEDKGSMNFLKILKLKSPESKDLLANLYVKIPSIFAKYYNFEMIFNKNEENTQKLEDVIDFMLDNKNYNELLEFASTQKGSFDNLSDETIKLIKEKAIKQGRGVDFLELYRGEPEIQVELAKNSSAKELIRNLNDIINGTENYEIVEIAKEKISEFLINEGGNKENTILIQNMLKEINNIDQYNPSEFGNYTKNMFNDFHVLLDNNKLSRSKISTS